MILAIQDANILIDSESGPVGGVISLGIETPHDRSGVAGNAPVRGDLSDRTSSGKTFTRNRLGCVAGIQGTATDQPVVGGLLGVSCLHCKMPAISADGRHKLRCTRKKPRWKHTGSIWLLDLLVEDAILDLTTGHFVS